jgi:hypothetical protein
VEGGAPESGGQLLPEALEERKAGERVIMALINAVLMRAGWKEGRFTCTEYLGGCPASRVAVLKHPGQPCRADNLAFSRRASSVNLPTRAQGHEETRHGEVNSWRGGYGPDG